MSRLDALQYTNDDKRRILEKYDMTVERVQEDVRVVREWLKNQPHLPEVPDDGVIERFLLINKFQVEITKQKIDGYYSIRSLVPELCNKDPNGDLIRRVTDMVHFVPLPKLTKDLYRVIVFKPKDPTPDTFDAVTYLAHTCNLAEVRLRNDYYHKELHIYDLQGVRLTHLTKFTPTVIKKVALVIDKVFTNTIGGLHFVNVPNFIDSFVLFLKNTLKPKLANVLFVHKEVESLYELIPKDILPRDYGGKEKSLNEISDQWRKIFLEHDELFQHLSKLKVNEELRQHPLFDEDDLFGIQGNFKQLNVD